MAIYRIARTGTVTTSGNPVFDVAVGSGLRPRIQELKVFLGAATASTYAINRPSAIGTRTSPVALLPEDPAEPTLTGITLIDAAIAWSVQPTLAAADLDAIALPATIGAGMVWTFPRGLIVAASGAIDLVNRATNSASAVCSAAVET